ncbi:hypothetical protein ACFLU8_03260 [Chloroflexota bacterium]
MVLEARLDDKEIADIVSPLNHFPTWHGMMAEHAFLHAMVKAAAQ